LSAGNSTAAAIKEKHSNYLASQMGMDSPYYTSELSTAHTMLALGAYDKASGSAQPNLTLTVSSAPIQLISAEFAAGKPPVVENTTSFDTLAQPPAPLTFTASGTGGALTILPLVFAREDIDGKFRP
jgi:hypothetical protein